MATLMLLCWMLEPLKEHDAGASKPGDVPSAKSSSSTQRNLTIILRRLSTKRSVVVWMVAISLLRGVQPSHDTARHTSETRDTTVQVVRGSSIERIIVAIMSSTVVAGGGASHKAIVLLADIPERASSPQ